MRAILLTSVIYLSLNQVGYAIPIPVASYTYDAPGFLPSPSYPDNGYNFGNTAPTPTELTDGLLATAPFTDPNWVGVRDTSNPINSGLPQPQLTFNLATPYYVNNVTIYYLSDVGSAVPAPTSVNVTFSTDGVLFTAIPVVLTPFANPSPPAVALSATFNLGSPIAQYVRMEFYNGGEWNFLSEIDFNGELPVPEPSTFALLGLGVFGMAVKARRRRRRAAA